MMMTSKWVQTLVAVVVLAVFGLLRWPVESALTRDLREQHLLPPPLDIEMRERLGQGGFAAAFGGMRSVIASMQNLQAQLDWSRQDWGRLESRFRLITRLQPRAESYWEMACWHLAYNASSYYLYDWRDYPDHLEPGAVELLRRRYWRSYVHKGIEMLEEGIRYNPEKPRLYEVLGHLYADPNKLLDHRLAAEAFLAGAELPGGAPWLKRFGGYSLSYLSEEREAAYELLRGLYEESESNHVPTLLAILFELQMVLDVPEEERIPWTDLAPTREALYWELMNFIQFRERRGARISDELREFIGKLAEELDIEPQANEDGNAFGKMLAIFQSATK